MLVAYPEKSIKRVALTVNAQHRMNDRGCFDDERTPSEFSTTAWHLSRRSVASCKHGSMGRHRPEQNQLATCLDPSPTNRSWKPRTYSTVQRLKQIDALGEGMNPPLKAAAAVSLTRPSAHGEAVPSGCGSHRFLADCDHTSRRNRYCCRCFHRASD